MRSIGSKLQEGGNPLFLPKQVGEYLRIRNALWLNFNRMGVAEGLRDLVENNVDLTMRGKRKTAIHSGALSPVLFKYVTSASSFVNLIKRV